MILLDTTVLVYAVGSDHPLQAPCRAVVAAIGRGELAATTTVEVIQEFAHVRARRRSRAEARTTAIRFVDLLSPLVEPNGDDLIAGLALFERHESLGAFDGVLAATVLNRVELSGLMSADRAFAEVEGLRLVDPAAGS
jgi:predicted nucleic acid-binding protein